MQQNRSRTTALSTNEAYEWKTVQPQTSSTSLYGERLLASAKNTTANRPHGFSFECILFHHCNKPPVPSTNERTDEQMNARKRRDRTLNVRIVAAHHSRFIIIIIYICSIHMIMFGYAELAPGRDAVCCVLWCSSLSV